jgi:radical SAM-linked protein
MRFASHRDIARAIERGVRKAGLPVAYSAGFSPHPKISYAGGAPTGTASEAEYLEIALTSACPAADVRDGLDAALPDGIDVIEVLEVAGAPGERAGLRLAESQWRVVLPGVAPAEAARAVQAFLAAESVMVERRTSKGTRRLDARAAVAALELDRCAAQEADTGCAILRMVVRHLTPAVRPDDILAAISNVANSTVAGSTVASTVAPLAPSSPPLVTRLAQGPLGVQARIAAAQGHEKKTRLPDPDAGAAAVADAAAPGVLAGADEHLPRGAEGPDSGPRAREHDGRLLGCSRPSDITQGQNQITTTGRQALATPPE